MLPLLGVRVLAIEQYGAGPFGTMLMADLGAEIVKIENPREGGDVGRQVGPHFFDRAAGDSHFYQSFNRNKRSIALDLKQPEGRAAFLRLVGTAQAVFNNLRGDQPEKLGLTYEALAATNPMIVCGHLSAYGRDGPRRSWPGYDYLMQAEAGYLSLTGEPDQPPARMGLSVVDLMTGVTAAFALLAGILGARAEGKGRDINVSLFDTALQNLVYLATWYLNAGAVTGRTARSGHPSLVPSELYPTADGWLFIMCNKEKFWPILCAKLGRPDLAADPRFATFADRLEHRALLNAELDRSLRARTTKAWLELLGGEVPAAPVHDVAQALSNPFVDATGRLADYARPDGSSWRGLAAPFRVAGEKLPTRAGPAMGADTDELLREVGYGAEEIAALRARRVV